MPYRVAHSASPAPQWHSPQAAGAPVSTGAVGAEADMEEDDDAALQGEMEEALQEHPLDDADIASQSDFQEAENEEGDEETSVVTTRKALQAMLGTLAPGKKDEKPGGEVRNTSLKNKRQATGAFGVTKADKQGASR